MDPILSTLSNDLLLFVEFQLSNNEVDDDEEMFCSFVEFGLTEEQARHALTYRERYLNATYLATATPIRKPGCAILYDAGKGCFVRE